MSFLRKNQDSPELSYIFNNYNFSGKTLNPHIEKIFFIFNETKNKSDGDIRLIDKFQKNLIPISL